MQPLFVPRPEAVSVHAPNETSDCSGECYGQVRRSRSPLAGSMRCSRIAPVARYSENDMRTNIDIDDDLMRQAMRSSGARTKRAVVEEALRLLIRTHGQASMRRLRGKVSWEGDLESSRLGRVTKRVR